MKKLLLVITFVILILMEIFCSFSAGAKVGRIEGQKEAVQMFNEYYFKGVSIDNLYILLNSIYTLKHD